MLVHEELGADGAAKARGKRGADGMDRIHLQLGASFEFLQEVGVVHQRARRNALAQQDHRQFENVGEAHRFVAVADDGACADQHHLLLQYGLRLEAWIGRRIVD